MQWWLPIGMTQVVFGARMTANGRFVPNGLSTGKIAEMRPWVANKWSTALMNSRSQSGACAEVQGLLL